MVKEWECCSSGSGCRVDELVACRSLWQRGHHQLAKTQQHTGKCEAHCEIQLSPGWNCTWIKCCWANLRCSRAIIGADVVVAQRVQTSWLLSECSGGAVAPSNAQIELNFHAQQGVYLYPRGRHKSKPANYTHQPLNQTTPRLRNPVLEHPPVSFGRIWASSFGEKGLCGQPDTHTYRQTDL